MGNTMILATLTLSVFEVVLLFFAAVIVGITIHFTITSRRSLQSAMTDKDEVNKQRDEWKLRYFNDIELKDKELTTLKEQLQEAEENSNIYSIEAEEMRKENKKLQVEMDNLQKVSHISQLHNDVISHDHPGYLEQLRQAQVSLKDHNEKIMQLLGNIDAIRQSEEKHEQLQKANEELSAQIAELRVRLSDKDNEIITIKKKEHLTKEMTSMLDNAYSEFNVLQSKMQKLEAQANSSKLLSMEYEDLKEGHRKMVKEFEDQKAKLNTLASDNQHLQTTLIETEEKLREANFQRQQLQKRVSHLEELNSDLQAVSDANKKLEVQLKRIGELESMLNMAAEERDQLIRRVEK